MAYRCPQAITGGAREAIRCKVSGSVCAHQKMCMMEGRIVLTDGAMRCPGRSAETMAAAAAAEPEVVLATGLERVELAVAADPEAASAEPEQMTAPASDEPETEDDLDLIPEDEPEVMLTDVEILPAGYTGPAAKSVKAEDLPEPETVPADNPETVPVAEPEQAKAADTERTPETDPEPAPAAAAEPEKKPGRKTAGAKSGKTGAEKSSGKK